METMIDEECIIDSDDEGALSARGVEYCCNYEPRDLNSKISHDLVNNRCYYSGGIFCDYFFHIANCHPLLGICCSHPAHPYGKPERFSVLLIISALTLFASAAVTTGMLHSGEPALTTAAPLNPAVITAAPTDPANESVEFFTNKGFWVLLFAVTLPVMILQVVLEKLAVLDMYFEGYLSMQYVGPMLGGCCRCIVSVVRCMKSCCFCCSLIIVIVTLLVTLAFVALTNTDEAGNEKIPLIEAIFLPLLPFAMSRLQSWLLWLPLDLLMPCCGFVHKWFTEGNRSAVREPYWNGDVGGYE